MNDTPLSPWQLAVDWPAANPTLAWWSLLCTVALANVLAWLACAALLRRRAGTLAPPVLALTRWQLLLSAGYVLGCGYRSVFPVFDIARQVMVDSWLSSVIVGRSVATVAELCFAAQWALLLGRLAQAGGSMTAARAAKAVLPMIAVAEICSWYAVLTTSNLGHVVEESLWGLSALLLAASFVHLSPRSQRELRPLLLGAGLLGLAYALYMFQVDVPMYWARWVHDVDHGRPFLSVAQGVLDASSRWVVSHRWADWQSEVVWMSLYFSVAVWFSLGLIHASSRIAPQPAPASVGLRGYRPLPH
jgi:hypothetical protein